jgi:hypothetical protein
MVPYGFLTSRKQRALQLYRVDKFYRATFQILLLFLLTQVVAAIACGTLIYLDARTEPQARENEQRDKLLTAKEAQDKALLRKLETVISLKSLIANRIPATRLIRNIEEAFLQNDGVCLTELKLSNGFDFNNPNGKDDFTIILSGSIKPPSGTPTLITPMLILGDFIKSLTHELPHGSKVDVLRNAVAQREGVFVPFDVKIHYSPEK